MRYNLKASEFETHEDEVKVVKAWIDPKFLREQKQLGNVIENKSKSVLRTCSTKINFNDDIIEITYNPDSIENSEAFISELNEFLNYISINIDEIYHQIANKLLTTKNTTWLRSGEKEYSKASFIEKIGKLNQIEAQGNGKVVLWINDNDLFQKHLIEVRMTRNNIDEIALSE